MTAWDSFGPNGRPGRIRGPAASAAPRPQGMTWREQRRQRMPQKAAYQIADPGEAEAAELRLMGVRIDLDAVFTFGLFIALLFIANWGAMAAAMIAGLTPLYLFARRKKLERVLIPRAFLFVPVAFAVFSTIWSEAPKETLKCALEFGITVTAGLLISSARDQTAALRGMACAFILYIAYALVVGGSVAIGVGAGGSAVSGLTDSKNLLADIASTGALACFAVILMAIPRKQWLWVGVGLVGFAIAFHAVTGARSAGALLGLAMGVCAMLGLLPLLAAGKAVRAWLTSMLAVILIAVGLSYRWLSQALIEWGAQTFDKDPTLTGRTYLWYRAADLITEKPMLGRGYYAFWIQGNPDAEGLWRYFGIDTRGGFTFHNTGVEILVTLGWLGLIVIAAVALIGLLALVRRFVVRPNLALVFWVGVLLYQLARTPIEAIGIAPFYFSTVLAFGAFGAAFGRVNSPRTTHVYKRPVVVAREQPRLVQVWPVESLPSGQNPTWRPAPGAHRLLRSDAKPWR